MGSRGGGHRENERHRDTPRGGGWGRERREVRVAEGDRHTDSLGDREGGGGGRERGTKGEKERDRETNKD